MFFERERARQLVVLESTVSDRAFACVFRKDSSRESFPADIKRYSSLGALTRYGKYYVPIALYTARRPS